MTSVPTDLVLLRRSFLYDESACHDKIRRVWYSHGYDYRIKFVFIKIEHIPFLLKIKKDIQNYKTGIECLAWNMIAAFDTWPGDVWYVVVTYQDSVYAM